MKGLIVRIASVAAGAAIGLVSAACASSAAAAGRTAAPVSLAVYADRAYYSVRDEVPLCLSLTAHASCAGRLYIAAEAPDGRCFFYSRDRDTLVKGDPSRMETWTPYGTPILSFHPGETVKDLALWKGRLPAARYTLYACLADSSTGAVLSDLASARFSVFMHRVGIVGAAIHVGDSFEEYMLEWEAPEPGGTRISARFDLRYVPAGAVLQAAYFATYFATNPVYLNGRFLTNLPGAMNSNAWHRVGAPLPGGFLRPGANTLTFESYLRTDSHYDDYMVKAVELLFN